MKLTPQDTIERKVIEMRVADKTIGEVFAEAQERAALRKKERNAHRRAVYAKNRGGILTSESGR